MINKKSKSIDHIVNNSKKDINTNKDSRLKRYGKYALTGAGAGILSVGSALAQSNAQSLPDTAYTTIDSRFAQETPYHIVKAGTHHSFNDGRDPNGITYFLVRDDYDNFMEALLNDRVVNMDDTEALRLYDLMDQVKNLSIFDKIGMMNHADGEDISSVISGQLGRSERVKSKNRLTTIDGEWDAEETGYIGQMMKAKGYDRMWLIVLRQTEGMNPATGKYSRYTEPNIILFDAENYNGSIAKTDKTPDKQGKDTLYIHPSVFGFYAGLGGDYTKDIDKWTPQIRLGLTTSRVNFGIKGGYNEYMNNFLQEFQNEQGNGWTKINTNEDVELLQFGPEVGFNVGKNVELCLGAQNNLKRIYSTGTTEQMNINPFTGEERYFKVEDGPTNSRESYWTIEGGARGKFRWFGLGLNAKYDLKKKKIDGMQLDATLYF